MKQCKTIMKLEQKERNISERIIDFNPIYKALTDEEAKAQASRCIQCPIEQLRGLESEFNFCRTGCPLNNNISSWLKKTYQGDITGAFYESNIMSPFPEILGRVCPRIGLCESSCTLEKSKYGSVSICEIETYINEKAFTMNIVPDYGQGKNSTCKVAIVGSGPAGMSCATFLLKAGVNVDIFEKEDHLGGLLTYGIPNFKLPKDTVLRRFQWMEENGLKVHVNTEIGKDISISKLLEEFDYIFLGLGAPEGRSACMENEYAHGVYHVMELLTKAQKKVFNQSFENFILENKNVIVIGGGDSAMDALRTAVRNKARSVKCIYRRNEKNMSAGLKEINNAKEEGVEFIFNKLPKRIIVDQKINVVGLEVVSTEIEKSNAQKKSLLKILENSCTQIEADIVILALGFNNKIFDFYSELDLKLGKFHDILVNEKQETSHPKIYAGGDVVRGSNLVVSAALDGRTAALSILEKII